jgi:hypothetical protein
VTSPRDKVFHYVKWWDLERWLELGWIARPALEGTHHGQHACLVEWLCDCKVVKPK